VQSADILDGTIASGDIGSGQVTLGKIGANAVTATELAADSVTSSELANSSVVGGSGGDIQDLSITAADIANGTITATQLQTSSVAGGVGGTIQDNTIDANDIGVDAVGTSELAPNAVTTTEILDGTVGSGDIANGAVGTTKLATLPHVRAYNSADQSIPTSVVTVLAFNSERWDNPSNDQHDPVTTNSRLTARTAGLYTITASVAWTSNSTGQRSLYIRLNGATRLAGQSAQANGTSEGTVTTQYRLAVGDYVEATTWQSSGIALNVVTGSAYTPEFSMTWMSP
jgi:hypothetical protein